MTENITYKVTCEKCDAEFKITNMDEYIDDLPEFCAYCGKPLDEFDMEEIESCALDPDHGPSVSSQHFLTTKMNM